MPDRKTLMSRRVLLGVGAIVVVIAALAGYRSMRTEAAVTLVNTNADKVAIRGYDTVAYFTEGRPTKGTSEFEYDWQGARWLFASAANRDAFAADPERYAPRYGGYCSMGLAMGEFSDADPEVWTIVDGKLYLNKAPWVRDLWRKGTEAYIVASEMNWNKNRDKLRVNDNLR